MRKFALLLLAVVISSMAFANITSSANITSIAKNFSFGTETRDGDPPSAVTAVVNNYNDVTVSWGDPGFIWYQADNLGCTDGKAAQDFEAAYNQYDCEISADFVIEAVATIDGILMAFFFTNDGEEFIPTDPIVYNIKIFADEGGYPNETPLHTTTTVGIAPNENGWTDADFVDSASLEAGTYWIGVNAILSYTPDSSQGYCLQRTGNENGTSAYWRNPGDGFETGNVTWTAIVNDVTYALKGSYDTGRELTGRELTGRDLTGFIVYRDGVDISGEIQEYVYEDIGLDAGIYEYTVTAIDSDSGESTPSPAVAVEIILGAPTNLTAAVTGSNVICQWQAPGSDRSLIGYTLYRDDVAILEAYGGFFHVDTNVPGGEHTYRVTAIYSGGYESESSNEVVIDMGTSVGNNEINAKSTLVGNYPNPFNPVTTISFTLNETGSVVIDIYDIKGRLVKNLVNDVKSSGSHSETWTGTNNSGEEVGSGIYFYKMRTDTASSTKKMILMK